MFILRIELNMYGERGYYINRFGELYDTRTLVQTRSNNVHGTQDGVTQKDLSDEIFKLKNDFSNEVRDIFDRAKNELKRKSESDQQKLVERLNKFESYFSLSKNYISLNNRRLVSVAKSVDKNDVINKDDLDNALKRFDDVFDFSKDDVLHIKYHRRIGTVKRSKDPFDVVVKKELSEVVDDFKHYRIKTDKFKFKLKKRTDKFLIDGSKLFVRIFEWNEKLIKVISKMYYTAYGVAIPQELLLLPSFNGNELATPIEDEEQD